MKAQKCGKSKARAGESRINLEKNWLNYLQVTACSVIMRDRCVCLNRQSSATLEEQQEQERHEYLCVCESEGWGHEDHYGDDSRLDGEIEWETRLPDRYGSSGELDWGDGIRCGCARAHSLYRHARGIDPPADPQTDLYRPSDRGIL